MAELKGKVLAIVGNQLYGFNGQGYLGEAYGGVDGEGSENFELALEVLGLRGSASTVGLGFEFTDIFNGMVYRAPKSYVVLGNSGGSAIDNPYLDLVDAETTVTPIYETKTRTVIDQAKVDEAQKAYDEAVKANQVAKDTVVEKETAYKDAQTKFETAQKQLADLQNGTVNISSLEQAVKDAETQLEKDLSSLQTAKETLALAKANAKNAEHIRILGLKAEQDKAEAEAKRLADLEAKDDAKITPISTQAGVTQVGDQISYSRVEKYKSLPNTGSQESLLGLLGAGMLLGLGYTGKRRRKN